MSYYIDKVLVASFEDTVGRVREALKKEGFGIITEIDMHTTLKEKLNVDFRKYKILGACNPSFAYKALQYENKVGTMLPCNVIVQELSKDQIEVTAVDPVASMMAIDNPGLSDVAKEIKEKLTRVIASLYN